ncbi:MAG TPA: PH domain-containing protein [Verrucomicrobiae bacterium]|nr:PH domain-containing protein [Verrucomicrobiae bacterium]
MNGTRKETILAQERLHPAIFIFPVITAAFTSLPTVFALFMVQTATSEFTSQFNQILGQHTSPSDGYLYFFACVPVMLTALPVLLVTSVAFWKSTVTLTDRRLTYRTGLIRIVKGELPLENVDAIFTEDPLLGRVFGYGTVVVTSVGGIRLRFQFIGSPSHFYEMLKNAVNRAKGASEEQSGPAVGGKMAFAAQSENDDSRYMPKG